MATLTSPDPHPPIVRLSGPQGIVAATAQALGFQPSDSIVLVALRRPRGRVGPVLRADLPALDHLVADFAAFARRYADSLAVLVYHDGPRPRGLDTLAAALRRTGVPISWILSIREGRIRDAGTVSRFNKDNGIPVLQGGDDQYDRLMATSALVGRRVLASRKELAASIAPPPNADLGSLTAAIDQAARLRGNGPVPEPLSADLAREIDEMISGAIDEYARRGGLQVDTAARIIAAMAPTPARDHVLARAVTWPDAAIVAMLAAIAARCPSAHAAQLCSVLGAAAYRFGDGALAHCALDRAEEAQPRHRLTSLLRHAIVGGVHPSTLALLGRAGDVSGSAAAGPPPS